MKFLPFCFLCLFMTGCGGLADFVIYTAGTFSGKVAKDYYDKAFEPKAVDPKAVESKAVDPKAKEKKDD